MSQVLYQKYRPKDFNEVYGQNHITTILEKTLESGNFSHAYLFEGPRGTGKTSVARIAANRLRCAPEDIIEIDAASHRKVEHARTLRESVRNLPFRSEKKVYIIDEVHMLTTEAFNTLLKTIEEPPSHTIFILATTEPHKIPDTIRSRCEIFQFKRPSIVTLKKMVEDIAKREGVELEAGVSDMVSFLGDGSFRDTQTVLQKLIAYFRARGKLLIKLSETETFMRVPSTKLIQSLLSALAKGEVGEAIEYIQRAKEEEFDAQLFMKLLIQSFRKILQLRFSPSLGEKVKQEEGEENYTFFNTLARERNALRAGLLQKLLENQRLFQTAQDPYIPLELAILHFFDRKEGVESK